MKSVPIGLSNLVYAICTADVPPSTPGAADGYTAYDSVVRVMGAITANFSPNASNDTLFADDGPYETASTLGAMTLELNVADVIPQQRAELLGATYDAETGLLMHSADDIPPYVAVGMSVKKSNGADRLLWYLKGKFAAPDDNNQTKADSINWNTPTITGNFLRRDSDGAWRISLDTDDVNALPEIKNNWFKTPNVKNVKVVDTPVFEPASGDLSKAAATNIKVTSSTVGATVEYKFGNESVWKAYPELGIPTTDLTIDSIVVVNARAVKSGMITASANVTYRIIA